MLSKAFIEGFVNTLVKRAYKITPPGPWYSHPVSGTVGRVQAALPWLIMGDPAAPWEKWTPEDIEMVKKMAKEYEQSLGKSRAAIDLGEVHPVSQLSRVWKNPNTNVLSKILGSVMSPIQAANAALSRADYYDPFSNTITAFQPREAILAHEIGHERDFARRDYPIPYALARSLPFVGMPIALVQEYLASHIAGNVTKVHNEEIRNKIQKILVPAYGSYVGAAVNDLLGLASSIPVTRLIAPLVGILVGHAVRLGGASFGEEEKAEALKSLETLKRDIKLTTAKNESEETEVSQEVVPALVGAV